MKQNKQKTTKKQTQTSFWQQEVSLDLSKSPVLNFLKKHYQSDLSKSPVLNFCKREVTLGGFIDVSKSPVLNWFVPLEVKTKTRKIASDEIVVKALTKDIIVSCLTVSVLFNLFMLIAWMIFKIDPSSRLAILRLFFG